MRARYLRLTSKKAQELLALKKEAERDGAFRVAKRMHAVLLNDQHHSSGEIARLLAAPRSKVSLWLGQYEEYGWEALLEGHRSGRPNQLEARQRQGVCDILDSGPVAYGFVSGVWTSPMIARVIQEEYQVNYHPGHVRKLLKDLGFSVQRPRKLLAKGDPALQDRWQRYTYPRLKKKPLIVGPRCSLPMRPAFGKTPRCIKPGPGAGVSRSFLRPASATPRKSLAR